MKELSIVEKATRYDEALKEAVIAHKDEDRHLKATLERIFPELKESENERMIQYFKDLAPFDKADELYEKYGFSHKDAIAWLEKQGEHAKFRDSIQIGDKVTRNQDGVLVNLSQLNRVAKKQGEQKSNPCDGCINRKGCINCENGELRETEQKPEWSEEDEKQARQIERIVHDDGCTKKLQKQIADWFKSLKERYTWKPSDEQMKVLQWCMPLWVEPKSKAILESLINDLKKLREEQL